MKENNEKKMKDEDEISKLIKAFPKDIAPKYKSFPMLKITIITKKDTGSTQQEIQLYYDDAISEKPVLDHTLPGSLFSSSSCSLWKQQEIQYKYEGKSVSQRRNPRREKEIQEKSMKDRKGTQKLKGKERES